MSDKKWIATRQLAKDISAPTFASLDCQQTLPVDYLSTSYIPTNGRHRALLMCAI